ncbi:MAG: hypothetical protein JRF54_01050 [Deltaproteobacteria bacterium]|nr:hypothetical protein [Deltaproteobacteria bacterium]
MSLVTLSAIAGFVGALSLAVFASWLAFSFGRWLGAREAQRDDREHEGPVGSVVAATLGLLAFTLAMAFNMAHTKHSGRKALVREDVKAIQMAYDRAMLLPPMYPSRPSLLGRQTFNTSYGSRPSRIESTRTSGSTWTH